MEILAGENKNNLDYMKIYVLGSNSFVERMVDIKNQLCALGHEGWIHPDYEAHLRGERQAFPKVKEDHAENAEFKIAHDYIRAHYQHILASDAIIVVNEEKNGIKNYIGGNCLMEMGQAYVNNKKIFLLNGLPSNVSYLAEIKAMRPIILNGKLDNIS